MCVIVHVIGLFSLTTASNADAGVEITASAEDGAGSTTTTAEPAPAPRSDDAQVPPPLPTTTVPSPPAPPATTVTTTTAPPALAPAPAPAVTASTPPPPPPPPPPSVSSQERAQHSYDRSVPAAWRAAISARIEVIGGSTSWAWPDGRIQVAQSHADAGAGHLAVVITHEFGHLISFRYGSGAYDGAPPAGWPEATSNPAEHWADCVQQVFTGTVAPAHGLPPCAGEQLSWARQYLAAGPR